MLKTPLISIIVPIYNMEALLERALNSVLSQTFSEWECLLVDDGSTDRSSQICDEYVQKDSRFRVFHKRNGGVSSARQCGLENALGVYTIHVDPDDWIDSDMLTCLYQVADKKQADMVMCDFMIEKKRKSYYYSLKPECLESSAVLNQLFLMKLHGSCCNKLIRRSCYLKNNIFFPKEMIMWEDLFVCCRILQENIRLAYIPKAFYHYDCSSNEMSVVRSSSRKKIESKKFFINYFEKFYGDKIDFYNLKKDVKKGLLRLKGVKRDEIVKTYEDVNKRLIASTSISFKDPLTNALKFVLDGKCFCFVLLYLNLHCWMLKKLSLLKRLIKNF